MSPVTSNKGKSTHPTRRVREHEARTIAKVTMQRSIEWRRNGPTCIKETQKGHNKMVQFKRHTEGMGIQKRMTEPRDMVNMQWIG